jgi:hypothetical protein
MKKPVIATELVTTLRQLLAEADKVATAAG